MRGAGALLVVGLAVALAAVSGCGIGNGDSRPTVLAAASLVEVLPEVDPEARYSFAGSDTLAAQLREGAPADVYATADSRLSERLHAEGLVEEPRVFAMNRLVLLVPRDNPAEVHSLEDLERGGARFVMADAGVPAGDYTRRALAAAGLGDLVSTAVSQEADVLGVVQKVALGEADAGFAYATDAARVGGAVRAVPLPADAAPEIEYSIAAVVEGPRSDAGRAHIARVTGPEGRAALRQAGFGVP